MSLESFTRHYMATALWSTNDESDESGGNPMDYNYSIDDIAPNTRARMEADCKAFYAAHSELFIDVNMTVSPDDIDGFAGHDFWLTRCGHGAGFWDGDWKEPAATILDKAAKAYGNVDLYVGDDKQIHM